eukprot:2722708-Rhodomonas_salina.1
MPGYGNTAIVVGGSSSDVLALVNASGRLNPFGTHRCPFQLPPGMPVNSTVAAKPIRLEACVSSGIAHHDVLQCPVSSK